MTSDVDLSIVGAMSTVGNLEQVRAFFRALLENERLNFHPENTFSNYVVFGGGPAYSDEQAVHRDLLMGQSFEVCNKLNLDTCAVACQVWGRSVPKTKIKLSNL